MPQSVNVLLVEDSPADALIVESFLNGSALDFSIETKGTLTGAVEIAKTQVFDIILLDLTLPDSEGLATFTLLHSVIKATPIVVLTGIDSDELGVKAVSEGAHDYIMKTNLTADTLVRAIRYTIERVARQLAEGELAAAGAIQRRLFPRANPKVESFDISGRCRPAAWAGGDFYDFFNNGGNRFGVVVADVAGHGIGPAITMSQTRALIRAFSSVTRDAGEILTRAGKILAMDLGGETFVSVFLAQIDVVSRSLRFAAAGQSGFVLSSNGRTKSLLKSNDPPLGLSATAKFETSREIRLDEGDSILLFTDGFVESVNSSGEAFGKPRVFETVREASRHSGSEMLDHLFKTFDEFCKDSSIDDDLTAVVIKASAPVKFEPAETGTPKVWDSPKHREYTHFGVDRQNGIAILRIVEKEILTPTMCADVKSEILAFVDSQSPQKLIVDFKIVVRFSSEAINVCFHLKRKLDAIDSELRLSGLHPQIREAFQALNLDGTLFQISDTIGDALDTF